MYSLNGFLGCYHRGVGKVYENGLTVITAIFGDYDEVPPIPAGFDNAVLVSDIPIDSAWRNKVIDTQFNSFLASKIPKFRPDLFCETEYSVWIDANIRDPKNWLCKETKNQLKTNDFVLFGHPNRKTITREVKESRKFAKYNHAMLELQLSWYLEQGFPDNIGLWACGIIARKHNANNIEFGNSWFLENARWSIQDQISFAYLVWERQFSFGLFPGNLWKSPLRFMEHKPQK